MTKTYWIISLTMLLLIVACGGNESTTAIGDNHNIDTIQLQDLQTWQRFDEPVLRDPFPGYEVAADPHVFRTEEGSLRMVYSGTNDTDNITIKLASANIHSDWTAGSELLDGSNAGGLDLFKETSFYRLSNTGKHQIYYIGYQYEEVYSSQIFLAEADALNGPYTMPTEPIIPNGMQRGNEVATITSPSIVEFEDRLYMVYCAWDAFPDPTLVWVHGATSDDDGQTWNIVGEVPVPVCMEGSFTRAPDGLFYAVAQVEDWFTIGRSESPFGSYDMLPEPVMRAAGAPWEIDEMNTPQLFFEDDKVYLYYTGADYSIGWWTMLATTNLSN